MQRRSAGLDGIAHDGARSLPSRDGSLKGLKRAVPDGSFLRMTFELADLEALGAKSVADFKETLRTGTPQGQPAFDLAVAHLKGKL